MAEVLPEILPQVTAGNPNENTSQSLDRDTLFTPSGKPGNCA